MRCTGTASCHGRPWQHVRVGQPRLGFDDHIHFTRRGAQEAGERLEQTLLAAWQSSERHDDRICRLGLWAAFVGAPHAVGWKRVMPGTMASSRTAAAAAAGIQLALCPRRRATCGLLAASILVNHFLTRPCGRNKAHFVTTPWRWHCFPPCGVGVQIRLRSSQTSFPEAPARPRWTNGCFPWASLLHVPSHQLHRGCTSWHLGPSNLPAFPCHHHLLPQLVAGPIVQAKQFCRYRPNLTSTERRRASCPSHSWWVFEEARARGLGGAWLVDPVFERPAEWVSWEVMSRSTATVFKCMPTSFRYTDMAKGMAGLLGITPPEGTTAPLRRPTFGGGGTSLCRSRWKATSTSPWAETDASARCPCSGWRRCCSAAWCCGEGGGRAPLAGGTLLAVAGV